MNNSSIKERDMHPFTTLFLEMISSKTPLRSFLFFFFQSTIPLKFSPPLKPCYYMAGLDKKLYKSELRYKYKASSPGLINSTRRVINKVMKLLRETG